MIDFSKLTLISSEERERMDREYLERTYAAEDRLRDDKSKTAITLTLAHEPEVRHNQSGDRFIRFYGHQEGQNGLSMAYYKVPKRVLGDDQENARFDALLRDIGGGDKISFAGHWKLHTFGPKDEQKQRWEFNSQHFAQGELTLPKILEKAAIDRGDVSERASGVDVARLAAATKNGMGI